MAAGQRDSQPLAGEIQMRLGGIHMRNFGHIQTEPLQDDLGVGDQCASAQLGARVATLLKDQDTRDELRSKLREMKCGREAGRSPAEDQDIGSHGQI